MELVMLGTGHAVVTEYYNTCFVLRDGEKSLLVDGGGGGELLCRLKRAKIGWDDIDEIFVTHKHTDHILGIVWMMRLICSSLMRGVRTRCATIYANEEVVSILRIFATQLLSGRESGFIDNGLNLRVVRDGETCEVAGHEVQFFDIHSHKASQMGFTMQIANGVRLACCGDEPYNPVCREYVQGCDWLLHEAFCLDAQADVFRPHEKSHSTVKDAALNACELGVGNLVLYHTEDRTVGQRKELYTAEARRYFGGNVFVPDDLEVIALEP